MRNNVEDVVKEDYGMEYFDFTMQQLRIDDQGESAARDPSAVIDVRKPYNQFWSNSPVMYVLL